MLDGKYFWGPCLDYDHMIESIIITTGTSLSRVMISFVRVVVVCITIVTDHEIGFPLFSLIFFFKRKIHLSILLENCR